MNKEEKKCASMDAHDVYPETRPLGFMPTNNKQHIYQK